MYGKPIQSMDDITFDDRAVGVLALVTMYQMVTFLILQLIMFIPGMIVLMLAEKGLIDKDIANTVSISLNLLIELVLIVWLVRRGKKSFLAEMSKLLSRDDSEQTTEGDNVQLAFTEGQLETMVGIVAGISILWCIVFGVNSYAMKIVLTFIEGFAFIFLITFMTVRFWTTREIRRSAAYCLILTTLSLWIIQNGI